jgi:hypothetical protein
MTTILVEGPDGSGKTTLIEKARGSQNEHYFIKVKASRYPTDVSLSFQYLSWLHQCPHDLMLDRLSFVSERIYGPLLRGVDLFKNLPLSFGIKGMDAVVYCRPNDDVIFANVDKSVHLKGVSTNIGAIITAYDDLMRTIKEKNITQVFNYDYNEDEPTAFWRHVWSEAKRR